MHKPGKAEPDPLHGRFLIGDSSAPHSPQLSLLPGLVEYEPDPELRNTEQVPLLEETGYKGPPSRSWYGIFAPAGTPRPIVDRLNKEITAIINRPDFRDKHLTARSLVPAANTPEQFTEQMKRERSVAEKVVRDAGFEPQ